MNIWYKVSLEKFQLDNGEGSKPDITASVIVPNYNITKKYLYLVFSLQKCFAQQKGFIK